MSHTRLPSGWHVVRFGDVVRNVNINESDPLASGLERYVGLEHLDPDSLHIKRWGLIADGTTFTRRFRPGQVLFGKRRAYQRKAAVADFDGICSGDILVFEPSTNDLIPELLPFIVQSDGFFDHALDTSAGSLSPRTKWSDLAAFEISLPPLDEQRRIAEILWAADSEVRSWNTVVGQLEELRGALLSQLYQPTNGEQFVPLKMLCKNGTQNGLYKPKSSYGTGIEVVHMGDIFAHDVIKNMGMQRINLSQDEIGTFQLYEGDLLFARRSIVRDGAGKCSIVGTIMEPIAFESSIIRVSLRLDAVYPLFLMGWFQSPYGKRAMQEITRQGSIAGIAASDLQKIEILLPPIEKQIQIACTIQEVNRNKEKCADRVNTSVELKQKLRESILSLGSSR